MQHNCVPSPKSTNSSPVQQPYRSGRLLSAQVFITSVVVYSTDVISAGVVDVVV